MSFKLDFKKFKKIKSDSKSTTLQHPDGHNIVIAHKPLSTKMLEQLAALPSHLAEGGDVPDVDPQKAKEFVKGATGSGMPSMDQIIENVKQAFQPAPKPSQKPNNNYADGGDVSSNQDSSQSSAQDSSTPQGIGNTPAININIGNGASSPVIPEQLANSSQPMPAPAQADSSVMSPQNQAIAQASNTYGVDPEKVAQMQAPVAAPGAQQQPMMQQQGMMPGQQSSGMPPQAQQPGGAAPQQPDPYGNEAYAANYLRGVGEQKSGIMGEANAMDTRVMAERNALDKAAAMQQQQMNEYKQHYAKLDAERQGFQNDINNAHIDPKHYLTSRTGGQRVMNAIGLILGGISGGMLHTENPALKFLNSQIDRDIDAQKAELGKSENLLSANMKQFGNLRDATDMTRVMSNDMMANQLKKAATTATSQQAKARALQAVGQLDQQSAPILSQIAMRRTLTAGVMNGTTDPSSAVRLIVPEHQQPAAYKELSEAQELTKTKDNIMSAFDRLSQINTPGNRVMNPLQSKREIDAIKGAVIPGLSKATAGRFTEQDAGIIEKIFNTLGSDSKTMQSQRAHLLQLIQEKMNFPLLDSYGIKPQAAGRFNNSGQSRIQESAPVLKSR